MVEVSLEVDESGLVRVVRAAGHAGGFRKGRNPVCAAASVLLRTFLRWLEEEKLIRVEGEAPAPGYVFAKIGSVPIEIAGPYEGASRYLIGGLTDLADEDPDQIELRITRFKE